jgi:hypothetical protein
MLLDPTLGGALGVLLDPTLGGAQGVLLDPTRGGALGVLLDPARCGGHELKPGVFVVCDCDPTPSISRVPSFSDYHCDQCC